MSRNHLRQQCQRCGRTIPMSKMEAHIDNCSRLPAIDEIKAKCVELGVAPVAREFGLHRSILVKHIKAIDADWLARFVETQSKKSPCGRCGMPVMRKGMHMHAEMCDQRPTPEEVLKALQTLGVKKGSKAMGLHRDAARARVKWRYPNELIALTKATPKRTETGEVEAPPPDYSLGSCDKCGLLLSTPAGQRGDDGRCGYCADEAAGIVRRPKVWTSDGVGMVRLMW